MLIHKQKNARKGVGGWEAIGVGWSGVGGGQQGYPLRKVVNFSVFKDYFY